MTAAHYFDLVREMKESIYNHRLRLVESAKERGIKPTARLFSTTVPTVRKWLRRFQHQGPSGLLAQSRARHHQPNKTSPNREAQFLELRKTLPPSVRAASFVNSICPSGMTPWSASGGSTA